MQKFFGARNFILLIHAIIFCSCAPSKITLDRSLLSAGVSVSHITKLEVNIPKGWSSPEADDEKFIDVWLVKNDYSSSIQFIPIQIEDVKMESAKESYLEMIAADMKELAKLRHGVELKFTPNKKLQLNNKQFLVFNAISSEKLIERIAVFTYGNLFYQSVLSIHNQQGLHSFDPEILHNSVLSSIK